jgi:chemotaxis protein methyltransferase CheR
MAGIVAENLLAPLSSWLAGRTGLYFPQERWEDLKRGVAAAARDLAFPNVDSYIRSLLASEGTQSQIEGLANHLTVGETYFFRHRQTLEALRDHVLPQLIQARRQNGRTLRIWSAGCCTGEEAYSLAILLRQILPDWKSWKIAVLGTDINTQFLRRARGGVYRGWSFRETPAEFQQRHFSNLQGDCYEILPEIRSMVAFEPFNLAQEAAFSLPGGFMDLILCRNVLMYFSLQQARETVRRLRGALAADGWLAVSPTEASQSLMADFTPVAFEGAVLYRKTAAAAFSAKPLPLWQLCDRVPEAVSGDAGRSLLRAEALPAFARPLPEPAPPSGPPPSEGQARDLYELGDYSTAAEILQGALSRTADDARCLTLMARIRANQGALDEALAWCEKAIAAEKLEPGAHYLLGAILQEAGRPAEAAAALRRALYLDQDFVLAHFALGNLLAREGRRKESLRHFENALRALRTCPPQLPLAESEGITPERMAEIVQSAIQAGTQPALSQAGER